MLRHFGVSWLLYWLAILLVPVHSLYPATTQAFLLQLSFVVIVAACAGAVLIGFRVREMPEAVRFDIPESATLIRIAIGMSVLGFVSLMYDKVSVQGIDYSAGLAAARQEWNRLGQEREGQASSVFSVVGYFFGSGYFVAAVLAITQTRVLTSRQRLLTMLACFILLLLNSAITGGRSSILLIAPMAVSAYGARRGLRIRTRRLDKRQGRLMKALALLALGYIFFIFYQRASVGDLSILDYSINFLPYLGIQADNWYVDSLDDGVLSSLSAIVVLTVSYVTHSFATVAAIIDAPEEHKTIIFMHVFDLLYKVGLIDKPDSDWFLPGRLPSTPGALWHQFGLFGFLLGSTLLGITAGLCKVWTARSPTRLFPLGAYTMMETTLVLSPALFAPDFLSFPFALISFVTIATLDRLLRLRLSRPKTEPGFTADPDVSSS